MDDKSKDSFGIGKEDPGLRRPVLLATVGDEMEAGVIQSMLESCGIPSRRRNVGVGAFMGVVLGTNRYGIEIDVAEEDLETAIRLLDARPLSEATAADLLASGDTEPADSPSPEPEPEPEPVPEEEKTEEEEMVESVYGPEETGSDDGRPRDEDAGPSKAERIVTLLSRILIAAALLLLFLAVLGILR